MQDEVKTKERMECRSCGHCWYEELGEGQKILKKEGGTGKWDGTEIKSIACPECHCYRVQKSDQGRKMTRE